MWVQIEKGRKHDNVNVVEESTSTYRLRVDGAGWIIRTVTRCVVAVSGGTHVAVGESAVFVPDPSGAAFPQSPE